MMEEKNITLFTKHHILTRDEAHSRYEINLDNYSKVINIEALTLLQMIRQNILPAVSGYVKTLSETVVAKKQAVKDADCSMEETLIKRLSKQTADLYIETEELENRVLVAKENVDKQKQAEIYHDSVLSQMAIIRTIADDMEVYTPKQVWPFPSYGDLLFSIQ